MLNWANDETVRKNAFNQEQIKSDQHAKWFANALADPNIIIYILMDNDMPVGQCRLNVEGDTAEIDYSIESSQRGKGLGELILELVISDIHKSNYKIDKLIGKVKSSNGASQHCFEKNGFFNSHITYELKL